MEFFQSDDEYRRVDGDQAKVRFNPKKAEDTVDFDRDVLRDLAFKTHSADDDAFAATANADPGTARS